MDENKISTTAFADAVGVSRQSIYNYQKDSILPLKVQIYLKEQYGLNLDWYLHGHGPMLLFTNPDDTQIPNNTRLTVLLTETFNSLPDDKKYLVREIKKEYLIREKIGDNDEALEILRELKEKFNP